LASKTASFLKNYPGMKPFASAFLTICLFVLGAKAEEKLIAFGDNPSVGKYYDIRGIKMYCEVYGQGKPLLLIHGNGGSIKAFEQTIPYFAAKYQVIAVDSRAQGKSKDAGESLSFEMMADDFAALLDALHIDSAYVIGWSDGGINALLLTMRHPEKVIKLAATGANIVPDSSAFSPSAWQGLKDHYEKNKNKTWTTEKEKNDWKLFMLDWNQPNIAFSALNSIHAPSLIICGDHDMISIEHTVQIFQNIPGANLWILPRAGHGTLVEYPELFNKTVDDFFSKSPKRKK
jgi:pimeloyl-ACP methyl ester carboxylesterase